MKRFAALVILTCLTLLACKPQSQETSQERDKQGQNTDAQADSHTISDRSKAQATQSTLKLGSEPEMGQYLSVELQSKLAAKDWLTLVPAQAADSDWGQHFPRGYSSTRLRVPNSPGEYEIRLFRNWPQGGTAVVERLPFEVVGPRGDATAGQWSVDVYEQLKYVADDLPPLSWGQTSVVTDIKPLETLQNEPEGEGDKLYGYFELGNSADPRYSFVIVGDQFYLDRNNNEDLLDDGEPTASGSASVPIELELLGAQGQSQIHPYQIWYFFNAYHNGYKMYSRGFYRGELSFHGYTYQALAFEDQEHNGLLRDNGIWIDSNGNEKFEPEEHYYHHERVPVGPNYFELILTSL